MVGLRVPLVKQELERLKARSRAPFPSSAPHDKSGTSTREIHDLPPSPEADACLLLPG